MNNLGTEIAVVLALILLGGFFSAAEIALISLRDSQVKRLAETRGKRGRRLEHLVSDPNRFLASVQIGVTVATMLSSAFGAATIAHRLTFLLEDLGLSPQAASTLMLIAVTLVLAFFSLVLGELVPKRLALQRSEGIALLAVGPLSVLAWLFRPVVWLSGVFTNGIVRILGGDPRTRADVMSEEELQSLVAAHESLTSVERRYISDVFAAEATLVREVMVARPDVDFLAGSLTLSRAAKQVVALPHSRFPVIGRDADEVIGVAHVRDILAANHPLGRAATVADISVPVELVPGTKRVLDALQEMRAAGVPLAVVVDEYGGTDGIVTIEDLVEEIVGEMADSSAAPGPDGADPAATALRPGHVAEADGRLNLDDFAEITGVALEQGPYDTAGGFLMARLGRLPAVGDSVLLPQTELSPPIQLQVTAMDGRRVAKVAVTGLARVDPPEDDADPR